jgi:hypothetical protein
MNHEEARINDEKKFAVYSVTSLYIFIDTRLSPGSRKLIRVLPGSIRSTSYSGPPG